MSNQSWPRLAGFVLGVSIMMAVPASADPLGDEIAPTGKLRVAIAISAAGGAFWSTKNEAGGYAGVPVDLGKEMAAQLGVAVEYVEHQNSGQITDAASKGSWDVAFYVNNITDEKAFLAIDRERGFLARQGFLTNQPRTFGLTTRMDF